MHPNHPEPADQEAFELTEQEAYQPAIRPITTVEYTAHEIIKNWKSVVLMLLVVGCFAFLSSIFVFPPTEQASLRFYVPHKHQLSATIDGAALDLYGDKAQTDYQLLHLQNFGTSNEVLAKIVDSLDLAEHYGLAHANDPNAAIDRLFANIDIQPTLSQELQVVARDRNKDKAQAICQLVMYHISELHSQRWSSHLDFLELSFMEHVTTYRQKRNILLDSLTTVEHARNAAIDQFERNQQLSSYNNWNGPRMAEINKTTFLFNSLGRVEEELQRLEGQLTQIEVARRQIESQQPIVIRTSSTKAATHKYATAAIWSGISSLWVILGFAAFFWMRIAYRDYNRSWKERIALMEQQQ